MRTHSRSALLVGLDILRKIRDLHVVEELFKVRQNLPATVLNPYKDLTMLNQQMLQAYEKLKRVGMVCITVCLADSAFLWEILVRKHVEQSEGITMKGSLLNDI